MNAKILSLHCFSGSVSIFHFPFHMPHSVGTVLIPKFNWMNHHLNEIKYESKIQFWAIRLHSECTQRFSIQLTPPDSIIRNLCSSHSTQHESSKKRFQVPNIANRALQCTEHNSQVAHLFWWWDLNGVALTINHTTSHSIIWPLKTWVYDLSLLIFNFIYQIKFLRRKFACVSRCNEYRPSYPHYSLTVIVLEHKKRTSIVLRMKLCSKSTWIQMDLCPPSETSLTNGMNSF